MYGKHCNFPIQTSKVWIKFSSILRVRVKIISQVLPWITDIYCSQLLFSWKFIAGTFQHHLTTLSHHSPPTSTLHSTPSSTPTPALTHTKHTWQWQIIGLDAEFYSVFDGSYNRRGNPSAKPRVGLLALVRTMTDRARFYFYLGSNSTTTDC